MANIDSQINDRMQMYAGNPQGLMQRYAQTQELVDLLALQKMKNDRAAATSAVQGAMQPPPGTVKGQLEQEAMQGARNDVMRSMAPGIQQQGVRTAQMQNRAAMGLPAQAAPNMARMAQGGIVGYQAGGDVMVGPPEPNMLQRMGQGLKNMGGNMAESSDILREAKAGIGVPYENRAAAIQQVRDEIAAQKQNRDPNFVQRMGQKLMDMGLNVQESSRILKEAYSNIGKTYEEKAKGMAMGGIVGYQQGGGVKSYQEGAMVESDMSRFGIEDSGLTAEEARALDRERRDVGMVYGPFDFAADIRDIISDLPSPQPIPQEALLRRDMIDMTGSMTPTQVRRRQENIERQVSELPPEERMPSRTPSAENAGITAGMYDVRNMRPEEKLTMAQQLMKLPKVARERTEEKPKRDIDFRALREFLTAGGGQTSTAGALGAGARGLGAFQAAEQARADKIQQAANELQLKRDLAANDARMLSARLAAEYQGKMDDAAFEVAQKALEDTRDPLNQEFQAEANAIREQYKREPVVMQTALDRLTETYVSRAVARARQAVGIGGAPTTAASVRDLGLE